MSETVVLEYSAMNILQFISDQYKTQSMCEKFVNYYPFILEFVPIKKEIYKELILIAWHPLGWWDWCVSKHEKIKKKISV